MMEAAQAGGEQVAAVLIPRIARLLDIPDADKIGQEIEARLNPNAGGVPREVQQMMQQGMQRIHALEGENHGLRLDAAGKADERSIKRLELQIKAAEIDVKRMEAQARLIEAQQPTFVQAPSRQPG
jgi:hypothetical protein